MSLRVVLRSLRRTPGFTATAVLTLALGIGLSVAVFTVAEALLLRRLPFREQDRLVVLWGLGADRVFEPPLGLTDARAFARRARRPFRPPHPSARAHCLLRVRGYIPGLNSGRGQNNPHVPGGRLGGVLRGARWTAAARPRAERRG